SLPPLFPYTTLFRSPVWPVSSGKSAILPPGYSQSISPDLLPVDPDGSSLSEFPLLPQSYKEQPPYVYSYSHLPHRDRSSTFREPDRKSRRLNSSHVS